MSMMVSVDSLQEEYPLFRGVSRDEQEKMFNCLQPVQRSYTKGSFIILDEDDVPHVCMILRGSVHMLKRVPIFCPCMNRPETTRKWLWDTSAGTTARVDIRSVIVRRMQKTASL